MRWDRSSANFMEVWYATLNHPGSNSGIWLRYTLTAPVSGSPYCELWGFLFDPTGRRDFAAKERFPIDRLGGPNGRDDGALVRIADAWLSETHLEGSVGKDGRTMSWSLGFEPAGRTFQHLPPRLRTRAERMVSTVCSPNLSVPFSGVVRLDSDELDFDDAPGCQSHRWGRKHSRSWSWAHCSRFGDRDDVVFEGVVARAALGPLPAPALTFLYLSYGSEDLVFNEMKFVARARSRYDMPTWAFAASNDSWKIAGAARADTTRMFQVEYADPDGSRRYCANSEIADLAIELYARDGGTWRHRDSLTAMGTAHLEFGRPEPYPELPVVL